MRAVMLAALMIVTGVAAHAAEIAGATPCTAIAKIYEDRDLAGVRGTIAAVIEIMEILDQGYIAKGESAMTPNWSGDGKNAIIATAVLYCQNNPRWNLRRATAQTYEGLRATREVLSGRPAR